MHHAIGDTNEQCQENRHIGIHSMMFHLIRNRHTYQGSYRAYRNINTTGDHYNGLSNSDDQKACIGDK